MANPIPRTLETPPRSTGNPQSDFPLLVDYIYRAYQVITQSVNYINSQLTVQDLDVSQLPDPATATVYSAQNTANAAYALANEEQNVQQRNLHGSFTITDANDLETVTFTDAQPDTDYVVMLQVSASTGAPAIDAFVIKEKTYATDQFTATLFAAPGVGNSVTYDWSLIRNS